MRGKTGTVKIRLAEAPQHDAVLIETREDAGGEGGGERAILFVAACPEDFVHGAACQPAARQGPIDRGDAKRQHPMYCRCRPLDAPNPFAQHRQKIASHAR